jgi:Na+/glutamate symporter
MLAESASNAANVAGGWATVGLFVLGLLGAGLAAHRWAKKNIAEPIKQVPILGEKVAALTHTLTVNGNKSDPPTVLDRIQNLETGQRSIKAHLNRQDTNAVTAAQELRDG